MTNKEKNKSLGSKATTKQCSRGSLFMTSVSILFITLAIKMEKKAHDPDKPYGWSKRCDDLLAHFLHTLVQRLSIS